MPSTPGALAPHHLIRHSIAWRLGLGLATIVLTLGLVSIAFTLAFSDIDQRLESAEQDECKAEGVAELAGALRDQYAYAAHTIIAGNDSQAVHFHDASRRLRVQAAAVRGLAGLPEATDDIDQIIAASSEVERLFETQVLPLIAVGDHAALALVEARIHQRATDALQLAALARKTEIAKEELSKRARAAQHQTILLKIFAQILALATAVVVGVLVYRSIARPIAALSAATDRVTMGDLVTAVQVERDDELGQLARRFNEMTRSIRDNQDRLLQTERLAGLGRMAAGVAHEMNNPIGVILGYTKLLRRGTAGPDPKMLEAIEEEAERCHQVVEGLLDLTRGSVRHVTCSPVDLRELAEGVAARFRVAAHAPAVSLEISGEAMAAGDEAKLRQILVNLVGNAAESCGTAGRITLRIEPKSPGIVSVTVNDTGPGVDSAARDCIFDPFFTTKPSGTGLGLAISRAIARAHGGDLVLLGSDAAGASFQLTLPEAGQPKP